MQSYRSADMKGAVRRVYPRTALLAAAVAVGVSCSVAACGGSTGPASASTKTIVIATNNEIDSLDPIANLGGDVNSPVQTTVYETLLTTTLQGTIQPLLATSWNVTDKGLLYTFHLRKSVHFQNGKLMTATDVVYSFDRAKEHAVPQVLERFNGVGPITAVNKYTVSIKLTSPNSDFIYEVADPTDIGFAVLPAGTTTKQLDAHPIGTGPFDFVSYAQNSQLVLKVNRSYWNPSILPPYNKLAIRFITQDASQASALQAGQVSLITPTAYATIEGLKGQSKAVVDTYPNYGFWLNLSRTGITKNDKIAQAISLAIDRQALSTVAFQGQAVPGSTAFPVTKYALPWNQLPNYTMNIAKARSLLSAAGYPHGIKLNFMYPNEPPYSASMFDVLKSQLARAGINVTLQPLDPNVWLPRFLNANYELSVTDQAWYSDPERYVLPRTGWQAPPQQVLPSLTKLLDEYQAAPASKQSALFRQVQTLEAENGYPFIGLVWTKSYVVYDSSALKPIDISQLATGSVRQLYLSLRPK